MSEEDSSSGGDRFPPTRRSVIEAARSIDAGEREQALEALCVAYWKPIYKYVRWRWKRAAQEEELGATAIDPAKIASPESLEEFFEKEWVRSLFALAVEDLRKLCELRGRTRTYRIFESYDLEGDEKLSYERLSKDYGISVSDVTNALAWARREFRKIALARLRELCGSEEEFQREARAAFGWDAK